MEVRESGTAKPMDGPQGKHLYLFWPGEASRNRPRIQLDLHEDGRCAATLSIPRQGLTWRYASKHSTECLLDKAACHALFDEVATLPQQHPDACLGTDRLWTDSSEKANSVTRDLLTDAACVTIGISDRGFWPCHYAVRESDPVLLNTRLYALVRNLAAQCLPPEERR